MIDIDLESIDKISKAAAANLKNRTAMLKMAAPSGVSEGEEFVESIEKAINKFRLDKLKEGLTDEEILISVVGNLIFTALSCAEKSDNMELGVFVLASSLKKIACEEAVKGMGRA